MYTGSEPQRPLGAGSCEMPGLGAGNRTPLIEWVLNCRTAERLGHLSNLKPTFLMESTTYKSRWTSWVW